MPSHVLYSPFLVFSSVWDYVPVKFKCAGDVAKRGVSDTIEMRQSHGRGVHRITDQTRALKDI